MVLIIGFIIVCGSVVGGLTLGGGSVLVLLHVSEFVTVLGICFGVMIIASPISVLKAILTKTIIALKGGPISKAAYVDAMMMMYQVFMLARKEGLMALEDHLTDPKSSEIFQRYPSFLNNPKAIQFFVETFRPIVDGRIKPEQLRGLVTSEIGSMREEAHKPVNILALVGDSFPGIGICAAVLGIILTMGSVAEGAETVGHKVAAALTGTFLGVFGAYGFINPLTTLIESNNQAEERYFKLLGEGVISFANGMSPQMAIEMSRRSLLSSERPSADELEAELKGMNAAAK